MSDDQDYTSPPPSGHNAPPPDDLHVSTPAEITAYFDHHCAQLLARREELLAAMQRDLGAYSSIDDDDTQGVVAENRRMVETLLKIADERRVVDKRAFREAEQAAEGWFKRFAAPIAAPLETIKARMNDYTMRRLATEQAALRERAEAAERDAIERREAASLAIRENAGEHAVSEALAAAQRATEAANKARDALQGRAADKTRSRGVYGAVASGRTIWRWRVDNEQEVPIRFLSVDREKVNAFLAEGGRNPDGSPKNSIKGIVSYADISTQVR